MLLGALLLAPTSVLASGQEVIADCADNARIDEEHGPQDYSDALANLPSDLDEYTDCRQIISEARANPPQQSGGGGGGGDGIDGGGNNGGGGGGSSSGGSDAKETGSGAAGGAKAPKPAAPKGPPEVPPSSTLASKPVQRGLPVSLLLVIGLLVLGALIAVVASAARRRRRAALEAAQATDVPPDTQPDRVGHRVFPRRA